MSIGLPFSLGPRLLRLEDFVRSIGLREMAVRVDRHGLTGEFGHAIFQGPPAYSRK